MRGARGYEDLEDGGNITQRINQYKYMYDSQQNLCIHVRPVFKKEKVIGNIQKE